MRMTWATGEDYIGRLMPYLMSVAVGKPLTKEIVDAVEKPYRVKRVKTPHGRTHRNRPN